MTKKWIYSFGKDRNEGDSSMRALLGGKGANLAEISRIGLPVPPGFTLTTEACQFADNHPDEYPQTLKDQTNAAIKILENETGFGFGDPENPLLVSVRSGARASMPGMMDTVLNLGLNDATAEGLAKKSASPRFAWDSYRRFIQMYANVVLGVEHHLFESLLENLKQSKGVERDTELNAESLKKLTEDYRQLIYTETGEAFVQSPEKQLWGAISAVFQSWMTPRAAIYRKHNAIPEEWGTAVNIQTMVFGNMGEDCATGVAFTRNPSTGENVFYGEFLINAQGEDVVSGIRTPQPLSKEMKSDPDTLSLEEIMPDTFRQLQEIRTILEQHYKDMQDIEFTIQQGKLYMLQTRTGKRSMQAAFKIAVDMVKEGLIDKKTAITMLNPHALDQLLHPRIDDKAHYELICEGLPASPGAACGRVIFSADKAEHIAQQGYDVILVRLETSPEDIHGMHAARGIITVRGGMTSHAAVVARGMGRPCVSGAGSISINDEEGCFRSGGFTIKENDWITIDGSAGKVIHGKIEMILPELSKEFTTVMEWVDQVKRLHVRTNAETPKECKIARRFGAEGIGLCRTEHMFFDEARIPAIRRMIMAEDVEGRKAALEKILPMQKEDFKQIFHIMQGLPVTIRLLDPPLHEFLPHSENEFQAIAEEAGVTVEYLKKQATRLKEVNPMMGHRGCRLLVTFPEICAMQARAILEAVIDVKKESGKTVFCEIMIPLISTEKEFSLLKDVIKSTAADIEKSHNIQLDYLIGTMIELPRAALIAGKIAEHADFFSFGTNDLTQTVWGISRDDSSNFLQEYERQKIIPIDPFLRLDQEGVGEMIIIGTERGRKTRPTLKIGICGEHGGDPESIAFFEKIGLDYISCSPYRVPIAKLAAAQAFLKKEKSP